MVEMVSNWSKFSYNFLLLCPNLLTNVGQIQMTEPFEYLQRCSDRHCQWKGKCQKFTPDLPVLTLTKPEDMVCVCGCTGDRHYSWDFPTSDKPTKMHSVSMSFKLYQFMTLMLLFTASSKLSHFIYKSCNFQGKINACSPSISNLTSGLSSSELSNG
jgi:hypothetical protein